MLGDFHLSLNVFDPHYLVGAEIPQVVIGLLYVHSVLKEGEQVLVLDNLAKSLQVLPLYLVISVIDYIVFGIIVLKNILF